MVARIVRTGSSAGSLLLEGVDLAADLVATTLGPAGRAVLVGQQHAPPLLLGDGYAAVQQLDLGEPGRQMGVQAMRELAWRTSDAVGDGTASAIVMARAFLRMGGQAVLAGIPPDMLQVAADRHGQAILAELAALAHPLQVEQFEHVARQAAGGDGAIGGAIADAHRRVGIDGVVQVLEGHGSGDEVRVDPGLHFDQGWISPHFVDDQVTQSTIIEDPLIVFHLDPLNDLAPLLPVLEMIAKADRGLVLIAENVGGEALATLAVNKQRAGFKVAAVKAPGAGPWRRLMLEDLAIATGGTVIGSDLGTSLQHLRPFMAGRAAKVLINRESTTIVGGRGDPAMIALRAKEIRDAIAREKHLTFDRDQHRKRLARLEAGIATVRVGGVTLAELTTRHARARAASAALGAARRGGVVAGGSASLIHAGCHVRTHLPDTLAGRMVDRMFAAALQAPLCAIAANAGDDGRAVAYRLAEQGSGFCYDVGVRGIAAADRLLDPLPTLQAAVANSVSTAGRLVGLAVSISSDAA